jgi:hypothetical protein
MTSFLNRIKKHHANEPKIYQVMQNVQSQIHVFDLSFEVDSISVVQNIWDYKEKFPVSRVSSIRNAWHSDYSMHLKSLEINKLLMDKVHAKLQKFLLPNATDFVNFNIPLISCWAAVYEKGSYTESHDHAWSTFSGVFYAQASEHSSPLVFDGTDIKIKPHTGMCVVFPGYLYHSVPLQTYDEQRIVVSFNYQLNAELN